MTVNNGASYGILRVLVHRETKAVSAGSEAEETLTCLLCQLNDPTEIAFGAAKNFLLDISRKSAHLRKCRQLVAFVRKAANER